MKVALLSQSAQSAPSALSALNGAAAGSRQRAAACLTAMVLVFPGCVWLQYSAMATNHGQLLVQFASDAADLVEADFGVSDRYLQALEYPLIRAEDFSRSAARLPGNRTSLVDFDATAVAYRELFELMKKLRARRATNEESSAIRSAAVRVEKAAARLAQSLENG